MRPALVVCSMLLFFSAVWFACRPEDDGVEEESPFFDFFEQPAIEIDTAISAAVLWEYGFVFTPLKDGKVTRLGIKLPTTGTFTVRLWDLSGPSPVLLREREIDASAQHVPAFMPIQAVNLTAGDTLGVTILADAFYRIEKKDGSSFTFPRDVKNIRILSFHEEMSDLGAAMFPPTQNDKRVAPCVNVVFVAD